MQAMVELIQSQTFQRWLSGLKGRQARALVQARLDRLAFGNPGDAKPLRAGVSNSGSTMGRATAWTSCGVVR